MNDIKAELWERIALGVDPEMDSNALRKLFSYGVTLGDALELFIHLAVPLLLGLSLILLPNDNEWGSVAIIALGCHILWLTMKARGFYVELKRLRDAWNSIRWAEFHGVSATTLVPILDLIKSFDSPEIGISPPKNRHLKKLIEKLAEGGVRKDVSPSNEKPLP